MFDDLKLSPKDEDEMEDFRDYGDESDDLESKLDDYEEDDEDDDEEESLIKPPVLIIVAEGTASAPRGSGGGTANGANR